MLYEATASQDKTLEIVEGVDHGVQLTSRNVKARALVEGFLASHQARRAQSAGENAR